MNGLPVETPEVAAAKVVHFATHVETNSDTF